MTIAVLVFVGFVLLMMGSVVIGKATDKKEQSYGRSNHLEQDGFDHRSDRHRAVKRD
ncbi:hypothetical protein ACR76W_13560 [Enterococcus casseliflavus]|uniref:hypothetical protein n=1 Tax=Enterococcus casseliflavus TaxID=37734 RepID=UPI0004169AE1|nr:hypothetical protein [Enterococcus casseliflavus]